MFTNKKVIIFDMDGTLIDSIGMWNKVDRELIFRLSGESISEEDIQKQRDEKLREYSKETSPYLKYCQYLGDQYQSALSSEEIHTLRYEIAHEFLIGQIDYKPYAEEVIKLLKERGYQLAIATTTKKTNMDLYRYENKKILDKAPIDQYFALIYTREDAKEMKPNPEIFLKACDYFGFPQEACLIFEDSLIGVEAANRAGIEVVAIYDKYSEADWEEIKKRATYNINDYKELLEQICI